MARANTDSAFEPFTAAASRTLRSTIEVAVERDRDAGETTAVVVAIHDTGTIVGASCGDTGTIVVRDDATVDELTAR